MGEMMRRLEESVSLQKQGHVQNPMWPSRRRV